MVEVNFGVGYGPVSLNYEDVDSVEGFTIDWLVAKFAALPIDCEEWFPFYAYCGNAGHIIDYYNVAHVWARFDPMYVRHHTIPNWASPITFLEIATDAPVEQLQIALDVIREFASGEADENREMDAAWRTLVDSGIRRDLLEELERRDIVTYETPDDIADGWVEWMLEWLYDYEPPYCDGGGLVVNVEGAIQALENSWAAQLEERDSR